MYIVYAKCGNFGFGYHFFCSHGLHTPVILCSTIVAKVDTFRRPTMIHLGGQREPEL